MEKVQMDEKLKELTESLEAGVQAVFESEKYVEYLKVMSRFYNYSFRNTMLIFLQKPDASLVAGYSAWSKKFDRHVKRGEKGIKIIVPKPYKIKVEVDLIDPKTGELLLDEFEERKKALIERTIPQFGVGTVFDVSQTEGKELPSFSINELTGNVQNFKDFFASLETVTPFPISFEDIPDDDVFGYCSLSEKRIAIKQGISEIQTIKTAIHEIAHATLHAITPSEAKALPAEERKNRREKEVEAESVAYVVSQYYGIDTSDYSFGYVAGWSSGKDIKELKASLELIGSTAAELITQIDHNFAELTKTKEASVTRAEALAQDIDDLLRQCDPASFENIPNRAAHLKELAEVIEHGNMFHVQAALMYAMESEIYAARASCLYERLDNIRDKFIIYQLKEGPEARNYIFEPLERLEAMGLTVDRDNYREIYSGPLSDKDTLSSLYERFNINHPEDYRGHSLSVSDVIALQRDGHLTFHYVDSFGIVELPEFAEPSQHKLPAQTTLNKGSGRQRPVRSKSNHEKELER